MNDNAMNDILEGTLLAASMLQLVTGHISDSLTGLYGPGPEGFFRDERYGNPPLHYAIKHYY